MSKCWAVVVVCCLSSTVALSAPAGADVPGPTDYQSVVLAISPSVAGISISMIGGDSFVLLEVESGTEVLVIGYRGEPYLRIGKGGLVEENRNSPSTYLNEERYGDSAIPAGVSYDSDPSWRVVGSGGTWAWHDHRTHWMNSQQPPPGAEPGDQILEGVVPLFVDGIEVDVSVGSFWVAKPSPFAPVAGAVLGALAVAATWSKPGRAQWVVLAFALGAGFVVGLWQWYSLPIETGPSILLWVLPLAGLLSGALSRMVRAGLGPVANVGLSVVASVSLALWASRRWSGLRAPILPTSAPVPVDQFVTAGALTVGVGLTIAAVVLVLDTPRLLNGS